MTVGDSDCMQAEKRRCDSSYFPPPLHKIPALMGRDQERLRLIDFSFIANVNLESGHQWGKETFWSMGDCPKWAHQMVSLPGAETEARKNWDRDPCTP